MPVLRQVIVTISEALKNSPVLVQLFLVFFGLPAFFHINMTPFVAASLTISLNTAAFAFVIFRSGIDAVEAEQVAAAKVYGHSRWQILRFVLLPQAAAFSIGPLVGLLVNQLQVTSLISVIGVFDLTKIGNILNLRTLEPFIVWTVVGLLYYALAKLLASAGARIEKRLRTSVVWEGI